MFLVPFDGRELKPLREQFDDDIGNRANDDVEEFDVSNDCEDTGGLCESSTMLEEEKQQDFEADGDSHLIFKSELELVLPHSEYCVDISIEGDTPGEERTTVGNVFFSMSPPFSLSLLQKLSDTCAMLEEGNGIVGVALGKFVFCTPPSSAKGVLNSFRGEPGHADCTNPTGFVDVGRLVEDISLDDDDN